MPQNAIVKVSRYELHPSSHPTKYVVAFNVKNSKNGSEKYFEGSLDLKEAEEMEDVEICMTVWERIKERVKVWYHSQNRILGHVFQVPDIEFKDSVLGMSNLTTSNLANYSSVLNELQ